MKKRGATPFFARRRAGARRQGAEWRRIAPAPFEAAANIASYLTPRYGTYSCFMTPAETRQLLIALRKQDHRHVGVRPADATPAEAPCIVLDEPTANALGYAMVTAGQVWPDCEEWVL